MIILRLRIFNFFPSGDIQFHDDESVYGFESRLYLEKLKAMTAAFNVPKTLNIYVTKITANEDGTYLCAELGRFVFERKRRCID
ncbi:MAG: hypothetical protein IPN09_05025 [Bacteroidetes bacterium]|nr:hypothetical protein [Bacteroidota bacterium]